MNKGAFALAAVQEWWERILDKYAEECVNGEPREPEEK